MRVEIVCVALTLSLLASCTVAPHWSRETDWPGRGVGKVESRGESLPGPAGGPQPDIYVPVGRVLVPVPYVSPFRTSHTFHYQIRSSDGTLHIVASETDFEVGACVEFSGFADGPSRTHWSLGRATLKRSNDCGT